VREREKIALSFGVDTISTSIFGERQQMAPVNHDVITLINTNLLIKGGKKIIK
jgi:hypothetical protein